MTENLIDIWTTEARRIGRLPSDWYAWKFACHGRTGSGKLRVTGAVCPPFVRGKRKGEPNVRKGGPRTTIIIDIQGL